MKLQGRTIFAYVQTYKRVKNFTELKIFAISISILLRPFLDMVELNTDFAKKLQINYKEK